MTVTLVPISVDELRILADSGTPESVASRLAQGALPPHVVALRSLGQMNQGKSAFWCSTFYIVRTSDRLVVGGCGFKDEPSDGRVEIGYGVSPHCRNEGIATASVRELLRLAFATEDANEVLAQISPANPSSTRVVQKLGFERGSVRAGQDDEMLVQWLARKPQ